MKKFELPEFKDKGELNKFLVENENLIIAQKKATIKEADGFNYNTIILDKVIGKSASKEDQSEELLSKPVLEIKAAINSSNYMDTHKDLHVPSLWDKSIKENKNPLHLQEHSRAFKSIISSGEDLRVYVETVSWKSLGYNLEGKTQVLMYESKVRKQRNSYMHEQYAKQYVTNHSVGMQYVKMVTCINDEDYPVQKENWDKYIEMMVNKADAEENGFFWAVTEAKQIEGSAVALGSNPLTPTIEVKSQPTEAQLKAQAIKGWLLK